MLDKNTVNKVILMGCIANEPRWQIYNEQRMVCFQLITGDWIKKVGDKHLHEEYHYINVPENLLNGEKLNKDAIVYVQGRLQTRMSLDEQRTKHYRTEVTATGIDILHLSPTSTEV